MLSFVSSNRILLVAGSTDMRKSFNSLSAIVVNTLKKDPLTGEIFIFCNRKKNRIKLLFWESGGLWVCAKRLERGRFNWPEIGTPYAELKFEELVLLLEGIDLRYTRHRRWYQRV